MLTASQANSQAPQFLKGHIPDISKNKKVVVAGFLENSDRVFLARRADTKKIAPGIFHLPGGHSEPAESMEATLVRELFEEFRLDIQVGALVNTFEYFRGDVQTVGFVFFVQAIVLPSEIHFDLQDNSEVLWATRLDLRHLFSDRTDHNVVAAEKAFDILEKMRELK